MNKNQTGIGVIGFGGFALFAVEHFLQIPEVRIVGMVEPSPEAAHKATEQFMVPNHETIDDLVSDPEVDLVYIATPPSLHYEQAMQVLNAGKHVICEKPLAVTEAQGREMVATAKEHDLLMVTNLMQRYNPVFDLVKRVIEDKVLGEILHGYFENYASDEFLAPNHWFWDPSKSGGIFIEHAVHFFDLVGGWLGNGVIESAQCAKRAGAPKIEDQVNCTVRYGKSTLVNFYHGFTQPVRMDRQQLRLLFERGDVTLHGWVPTKVSIHAVTNKINAATLSSIFDGATVTVEEEYDQEKRIAHGHHKEMVVDQKFSMVYGERHDKFERYGEILKAMLRDQLAWIRDRTHKRKITEDNGYRSLVMACEANQLAHRQE